MASTTWENVNTPTAMVVFSDSKPWGGFSDLSLIANARVQSVSVGIGATFDTAQIVLTDADFGDGMILQTPIQIIAISGVGVNARQVVVFRGFAVRNLGRIDSSKEEVLVECHGYKWYMSKLAKIQGKIYCIDGVTGVPASEGSGLSIGGKKLTFEKFRMKNPAASDNSEGNILRAEACVFNQGGLPDCMTRTHSNVQVAFYKPIIQYDELSGLEDTHATPEDWNGNLWTWATILGHIERFWIQPYTASQAKIELSALDMQSVAAIQDTPIDFSLEGMNPLQALDAVVRAMPGRWFWFLEYDSFYSVIIRIKQHGSGSGNVVNLRMCPKDSAAKICQVNSNIESADLTEDTTSSVKYAVAMGGNIKLVTTVKLRPLWPKYDGNDFIDQADFEKWRQWEFQTDEAAKEQFEEDNPDLVARYKQIYREYGVPIKGQDFRASIPNLDTLNITGDMYSEYRDYEKDILNYFFDDAHIIRQVQPPNFNRYSDSVKVFMYDARKNGQYYGEETIVKEFKESDLTTGTGVERYLAQQGINNSKWVNPEDVDESYEFDDKNGIVRFADPQFQRQVALDADKQTNRERAVGEASFDGNSITITDRNPAFSRENAQTEKDGDEVTVEKYITSSRTTTKMESRDVYMTAMFSTDVATVAGKRATGVFDETAGAPFTEHLQQGDNSLIVHKGAFYPVSWINKQDTVQYREDMLDGKVGGSRIISAEQFDNYNLFIGSGGTEVKRAVEAFVENYQQIVKILNCTLPYMETGYRLGDLLFNIQNTNYTNLRMALQEIQYAAEGESDQYKTSYQFTNQSEASAGRPNTVANKRDQVEAILGVRIPYKFRI